MSGRNRPKTAVGENVEATVVELPPGMLLQQTLRGHGSWIGRIAWSPDGRVLASPSADRTIRLWNAETGALIRTLRGSAGGVNCVTWSPDAQWLASAADDTTVKLWDGSNGRLHRTLEGHSKIVNAVAWSPDGRTLASGSVDNTIRIWDAESGDVIHILAEDTGIVTSVAWSPDGRLLASAATEGNIRLWNVAAGRQVSTLKGHKGDVYCLAWFPEANVRLLASAGSDKMIRLWDVTTGRQTLGLEGHTGPVRAIDFLGGNRLLASKSRSDVRLWRCDTWEPVAVIAEPATSKWAPGLAFHPRSSALAAVAADPETEQENRDNLIRIWHLDLKVLLGEAPAAGGDLRAVHHTTAKIVLVGDSGVGKTGLGWRLAQGDFKEHSSTHGQQFWILAALGRCRPDGTECEAILWDLAGQPDYRLIHALFLDDADLVLLVFDGTDTHDPMHGVMFWLKQLNVVRSLREPGDFPLAPPTILVGARLDRAAPTLTAEELRTFCDQQGISGGYVGTSAKTAKGLDELLERMRTQIDWNRKTATVTSVTFKRIKDYVLRRKEVHRRRNRVVSFRELRRQLEKTQANWSFTDAEMSTAVAHLANYGYVRVVRSSAGEKLVLLVPELMNNLAASFVLEARRNPKGLGALDEDLLLSGGYPFQEVKDLTREDRDALLDSVTLQFLEYHICFRETDSESGRSYLIFPELINMKKPQLTDEVLTQDGVSYTVSGAVENLYSALVVLLGYTDTFTRINQWQSQARYEVGDGLVCGFRQVADRDGELDFVLYFGINVEQPSRTLFQGLFERLLTSRNVTVLRFEPVFCSRCREPLDRSVMRERLRAGKDFTFCNECGERLALRRSEEAIPLTSSQHAQIEQQQRTADLRTRFEQVIFQLESYVKAQKIRCPKCFISYAWGVPEHERWVERTLATDLLNAGITVLLDRWYTPVGACLSRFVSRIPECDRVMVVGTPLYRRKYENSGTGNVVAAEVDLIAERLLGTEAEKATVLPLLLDGDKTSSLPPLMWGRVYADFRNEEDYFTKTFDLILSLYGIAFTNNVVAELRDSLQEAVRGPWSY